ncbi:glycoside hydrolase family 15 protein [Devosia sp.]|uniref:glycoside hydrolase family 15 protein n=1 Tax=Devosia sp. TaxID=1871048 RepID=UPI003A8FA8E6
MSDTTTSAPGAPGIAPTWSSSAKDMVSTALGTSRIWATFGFGIVNEVYWPSTGRPQIRDLGFIIKSPSGWTEVKRAERYEISTPSACVPLTKVVHEGEGYRLELEFLPHPLRDALIINYKLEGDDLQLFTLLAPHLNGHKSNHGWAGQDLSAQDGAAALCLRADCGFVKTSAGYAGTSDGWTDFDRHGDMTWQYAEAPDGNIALTGALRANSGKLVLAFAETLDGARTLARSSLADDYDATRDLFVTQWENWARTLKIPHTAADLQRAAELSAAVIKVHEDRTYAGAIVASLSVPWGSSHDDPGGYHLVWTRDTVEAALALIAVGQTEDAARTLTYLIGTQAENGSWAQNYYPNGTGYWSGSQLDEVALPLLLMAKLKASDALPQGLPVDQMVRAAVNFIVHNGPMTDQDRWEENAGASPFTLAVTICALVATAQMFDAETRDYILSLADCWNERIESWTYSVGGPLCQGNDVDGYYLRIGAPDPAAPTTGEIMVRNVENGMRPADEMIGTEFLFLVRTGLRQPDDPKILNTVRLVDRLLRVDTPNGPGYRRYNGDGYGEHADGRPFDGTGIGRLWPLLTGERGHYAVTSGQSAVPELETMIKMTGPGGLIPEQVWDAAPIPQLRLAPGKPSGSAMPLVWAHGEFLKLLAAEASGRPAELLDEVKSRYSAKAPRAAQWHWRANSAFETMPADRTLMIECGEPFVLHWGADGWDEVTDTPSTPLPLGMHGVSFSAGQIAKMAALVFTFHFPERDAWAGHDDRIAFEKPADDAAKPALKSPAKKKQR